MKNSRQGPAKIYALVNNAASSPRRPGKDFSEADWNASWRRLESSFLPLKADGKKVDLKPVAPRLRLMRGKMGVTSRRCGLFRVAHHCAGLWASKHGIAGVTKGA